MIFCQLVFKHFALHSWIEIDNQSDFILLCVKLVEIPVNIVCKVFNAWRLCWRVVQLGMGDAVHGESCVVVMLMAIGQQIQGLVRCNYACGYREMAGGLFARLSEIGFVR